MYKYVYYIYIYYIHTLRNEHIEINNTYVCNHFWSRQCFQYIHFDQSAEKGGIKGVKHIQSIQCSIIRLHYISGVVSYCIGPYWNNMSATLSMSFRADDSTRSCVA